MGQIVEKRREGLVEASEVVSKPMQVDPREVESWARNPETALQHLATLLDALTQEDEDLLSWVTEALENCGVPDPSNISMLMERLPSTSSDVTYWAATLLGRMGEKAAVAQPALNAAMLHGDVSEVAKNRILWAIRRIGGS